MRLIRSLTLVGVLATVLAAVMGSYVRGKGAGLACPDWPLCHGRLLPPLEGLILLEWLHRLVVLIVAVTVGGATLLAWYWRLPQRTLALLVTSVLLGQAALGGLTVLLRLDPLVVALHQGLALVFFGALVILTVWTLCPWIAVDVGPRSPPARGVA